MRRALAAGLMLTGFAAAAAVAGTAPTAAFEATACQTWDWPARVAVGRSVGLSGSYTDWAEPGSVIAVFRGPHGQSKTVEDFVDGSGYWEMSVRFGPSETGAWKVTTTFAEPAATTITCPDRLVVVGARVPDTATDQGNGGRDQPLAPAIPLLAALAGFAGLLRRLVRAR